MRELLVGRQIYHKNCKKLHRSQYKDPDLQLVWCIIYNTKQDKIKEKIKIAIDDAEAIVKYDEIEFPIKPPQFRPFNFPTPCQRCIWCGKILQYSKRHSRYCSTECYAKYYNMFNWGDIVWRIFNRDSFTCQKCGFKPTEVDRFEAAKYFNCDHIIAVGNGGNPYDDNNLQTLCEDCHKKKTKIDKQIMRKNNISNEVDKNGNGCRDLREFGL